MVGPFIAFFRRHGLAMGATMLALITAYHLCDYLRGPMMNPYYATLGISKLTIAGVRSVVSLPASFFGIALGGLVVLRIGVMRSLVLGACLQPLAVAAFAVLGWHGGDFTLVRLGPLDITAFEVVMAQDSIIMSFAGVVLTAYMSSLITLGYTATQFALLASASVWIGKTLKLFSGTVVEALEPGRTVLHRLRRVPAGRRRRRQLPALVIVIGLALVEGRAAGGGGRAGAGLSLRPGERVLRQPAGWVVGSDLVGQVRAPAPKHKVLIVNGRPGGEARDQGCAGVSLGQQPADDGSTTWLAPSRDQRVAPGAGEIGERDPEVCPSGLGPQVRNVLTVDVIAAQDIGRQPVREAARNLAKHGVVAERQIERLKARPVETAALQRRAGP